MATCFTSTSGRTRVQSSFSSSVSNRFSWLRGVPTFAVLALYHAQDRLHGRDVGAVAVKRFIAEGETFAVDDQRDHHLLAVGTVIARVAPAHHRILLGHAFYIRAGQ